VLGSGGSSGGHDYKYYGYEPNFIMQPDPDLRAHALARSFTWYTRFFDKKDG
jgi:hypothetical protein